MNRPYAKLTITKKGERAARSGHPWVYGEEVTHVEGTYQTGDIVDVYSDKDRYLGTGFANDISKIRVRIVSRNANDRFDEAFWQRRVKYALDYRKTVMGDKDFACCRLIFGDADDMPGLTVDRYNDVLVAQTLCYGMDQVKPVIFKALVDELAAMGVTIRGIYERNDVKVRKLDGMEEYKGWYEADFLPQPGSVLTTIDENGILYDVDVENGQKTGFFLDQKYNRLAMQRIVKDKTVLDCFTYIGTFALNCGYAGAKDVLGVDASDLAVELANDNAKLNHLEDKVHFEQHDVFDFLPELVEEGKKFDVVILDPPAFTKSRSSIKNAIKGYREINREGLKLVKDGGYLASCTCSHFMDNENFVKAIEQAARSVHKRLRQIEFRQQSPDHPILWGASDSSYLKFYIFQVTDEK